jgi:hypothetical protein
MLLSTESLLAGKQDSEVSMGNECEWCSTNLVDFRTDEIETCLACGAKFCTSACLKHHLESNEACSREYDEVA